MTENAKIEWPKEKLLHYGADKLTKSELLAIILRTGTGRLDVIELAKNILRKYPKFSLAEADIVELEKAFGLETSKACEIVACFELGKRMLKDRETPLDLEPHNIDDNPEDYDFGKDILSEFGSENFS